MTAKLNLDGLPGEIAERARAVFGGVVNDLDQLLKKLGSKLTRDTAPTRKELLKLIAAVRKSLDARLSALERIVAGPGRPAARKRAAKAPAKAAKKAVRPAVRKGAAKAGRRRR